MKTVWLVYHYRGNLVAVCDTEERADAWCDRQLMPDEFYNEEWGVTDNTEKVSAIPERKLANWVGA